MNEGASSLSRPAAMTDRNISDTSNISEGDKERRRFNRTAQRGAVNRVLERMNSQSALLSETSSGFKTKGGASARRTNRLSLTDHGDFNQTSRLMSQSAHVGSARHRKPSLERLNSETSFGSTGSFGGDGDSDDDDDEKSPEKPASRPRPNLRSGAFSAANRVLGRMESKRTLTDLIEDTKTKTTRPMRTRSTSSNDGLIDNPRTLSASSSIDEEGLSESEETEKEEEETEEKEKDPSDDKKKKAHKNAALRVLGRMESKRTLTELVSDTTARIKSKGRTRPTLADLGIPERATPIRTRSEASAGSLTPKSARRKPGRASSTTGTPDGLTLGKEQPPKFGRFAFKSRRASMESAPVSTNNEQDAKSPKSSRFGMGRRRASMEYTPTTNTASSSMMSPSQTSYSGDVDAAQEAYALEKDAERKRLEAMELLRQAEEAEEEANRKLAEAAGAETDVVMPLDNEHFGHENRKRSLSRDASRVSMISAITVDDDDEEDDSGSESGSDEDEDDSSDDDSSDDGDADAESTAVSEANSDSSSDVYLEETEKAEDLQEEPKPRLVSRTQRLKQAENLDESNNGYDGLAEDENNSGDEEEIQRRAEERRRLRETGHIDIMSPARVGAGLNTKSAVAVGLSSALASNSSSVGEEGSNDDSSRRRRERDKRIRELEQKANTSSSSFGSAMLGLDSGEDEEPESISQADAERARRKAERMERRKRNNGGSDQSQNQSADLKAQRKAEREKEIEKRKAELEARRLEAQKRKEERRKLLGVRDVA